MVKRVQLRVNVDLQDGGPKQVRLLTADVMLLAASGDCHRAARA